MLYGKLALLETIPPWHGGGKMVERVSFDKTTFSALPGKFEAGTPNVAGALALAKAIEWYQGFERQEVEAHLHQLQTAAYQALVNIDDIRVLGYQANASVLTLSSTAYTIKTSPLCSTSKALRCVQATTAPIL